jgi:hypothetical protein
MSITPDHFATDIAGLPEARASELVELSDGDELELRVAPVRKRLGDATVRMLAYNGPIPGPVLNVKEGSEIVVHVENQGDTDATVHWHGLRPENRFDGTRETQAPILVGERFSAKSCSLIQASTGTTRISGRTTARRWGCTATVSLSRRIRNTGLRPTATFF